MLQVPQASGTIEGSDDEHPIVLAGDTAEQVSSLMWALYARYVQRVYSRVHRAQSSHAAADPTRSPIT